MLPPGARILQTDGHTFGLLQGKEGEGMFLQLGQLLQQLAGFGAVGPPAGRQLEMLLLAPLQLIAGAQGHKVRSSLLPGQDAAT